jgi:hypothetical protein
VLLESIGTFQKSSLNVEIVLRELMCGKKIGDEIQWQEEGGLK